MYKFSTVKFARKVGFKNNSFLRNSQQMPVFQSVLQPRLLPLAIVCTRNAYFRAFFNYADSSQYYV